MTDWNVVVKLRIMPVDIDVDLTKIQSQIEALENETVKVHSITTKPIAFGISALEVNLLFNDKIGGMDETQDKITAIEGVSEAEVTDLNRL